MLPQIGKVDRASFDRIIFPHLGSPDKTVMLGPQHGVDAAVIDLPDHHVMVVAEDPTFGLPVLMPHFGWAIVHICASDIAVLGVKPQYLTICLMLPPGTPDLILENIWQEVDAECKKLDIAIIGGHTGIYPGIAYPLNGGCTVMGIGTREQLTPASHARVGDKIILTKGPAIETAGILAYQAEAILSRKMDKVLLEKAKSHFFNMTVVRDALLAAPYAHAMHDATEGGLLNGIFEIAAASGTGVTVDEARIPVPAEIDAVCRYFGLDPLISVSEGTLVIAAPPPNTAPLLAELSQNGIPAWEVGEITARDKIFLRRNGKKVELLPVSVDPFWAAYFSTLEEKHD